jgi:hypothetical protein
MRLLEPLENRTLFASYTASSVAELITAIISANSSVAADTITLAAGASFSLTAPDNATDGPTGLPVIAVSGGGLTIFGNGDTIARSSAAGTPAFRLLDVAFGASLTLKDLKLQGGLASERGGGIYSRGTLSLENVTVQNNTAQGVPGYAGGYVPAPGGDGLGGGIYSTGALTLQGCVIQNNLAVGGRGGDGGLIPQSMPGHLTRRAYDASDGGNGLGGGLYIGAGTATVRNSAITTNTAKGGAGGDGYRSAGLHSRSGSSGTGVGGGIYIHAVASVGLDASTVKQTVRNAASSYKDIFGSYALIT